MTQQSHSLGVHPEKKMVQKDTYTSLFTSALFCNSQSLEQPTCPLTEEWIKRMWYIHTMEYYSARKENEIMSFAATWMGLEVIILSEVSQTEKEKYHIISHMLLLLSHFSRV